MLQRLLDAVYKWLKIIGRNYITNQLVKMKTTAFLTIAIVAVGASIFTPVFADTDLTVKWSSPIEDPSRSNSWFEMPLTLAGAEKAGWVEESKVSKPALTLYCEKNDHHFCILYDSYGDVVGIQFGLSLAELGEQDFYDRSTIDWFIRKSVFDRDCWTVTIFLVSPNTIAAGDRAETNRVIGANGVWIQTTTGFEEVSKNIDNVDSSWAKQACIPGMGTHFYYNMSTTLDCATFHPIFLLYTEDVLNAIGFQNYGKLDRVNRDWSEELPPNAPTIAIPDAPRCLIERLAEYGVISMHVYWTKEPWNIKC